MAGIQQLLSLLSPVGAVIQAIIKTYTTIQFFIQRINQILDLVESVVNSIAAIAAGSIGAAANFIESTMARTIPIILDFLARFIGLGDVGSQVQNTIRALQDRVDQMLDRAVEWIRTQASRLASRALGGNPNTPPAERVASGLREAVPVVNRYAGRTVGAAILRPLLIPIKLRYRLTRLDVVPQGNIWLVDAAASPGVTAPTTAKVDSGVGGAPDGSRERPYPIAWPKRPLGNYLSYWLAPPSTATGRMTQAQLQSIPGAELLSPTTRRSVPGGTDVVGIANQFQTRLNLVIGPKRTGRMETEMNRFKRLWERHGYDRSQEPTDADHVVELQMSGTDSFDNLWPLNSSENRSGGSRLVNTEVTIEDGTVRRVENLIGKYFKITSFTR